MNENKVCIVTTTTNEKDVASTIAHKLVESNLVACAQIENITSTFFWKGEVRSNDEFRIILKTIDSKYKALESAIIDLHNYDLPQIIKQYVDGGLKEYLQWVQQRTS